MAPALNFFRDGLHAWTDRPAHHRREAANAAEPTALSTYLGIGLGVGGTILIALVFVTVQIVRKRMRHRREIEVLQVQREVHSAQRQEIVEVPRPVSSVRCGTFAPLNGRAGWDALYSDETVHEPQLSAKGKRGKRNSVSLPKRFKQRGIQLRKLRRLTAIMESPRSKTAGSPAIPEQTDIQHFQAGVGTMRAQEPYPKAYALRTVSDEDVFVCPGSPKPHVLPSFAIRSPGRYGSGIALSDTQKAARSQSVGALMVPPALFTNSFPPRRSQMHCRSISLGAPMTRPPSGPVPPLPTAASAGENGEQTLRQGLCVSRMSSSSNESTGSSVLVTSPILKMKDRSLPLGSPSVEEVVADDDTASLKTVSQRQWSSPTLGALAASDGVPPVPNTVPLTARHSIRSNIARYSIHSSGSNRLSSTSTGSADDRHNRLSIPQIGTADRVSISRVSSASSLDSMTGSGVRKITTRRRTSRMSVSANGSPAERKKASVLRDISGNSIAPPTRQASSATNDSGRSSNGNPFQWDNQPLPKPSAMKGSPKARKGHRRQNCVRISTLTPQILGPPPSRPTSPSIMHGIEEETGDDDCFDSSTRLRFVSNQRPSRPNSLIASAPNLRIQTLRASITPSSPTLSAWNAFQEHGLPSEHSDSSMTISPEKRSNSRQSTASAFSIPSFPSPAKPSLSDVHLPQPIPEFCLSRPSTDTYDEHSASPFALHDSSDSIEFSSSPPVATSLDPEYDPAHPSWPLVDIPAPQMEGYDPASPPTKDDLEPGGSSPYFPVAQSSNADDDDVSPRSRVVSSVNGPVPSDSPPCSPKTMPEGFKAFFDDNTDPPRATEKLTSENASAMMARLSTPSRAVDFPGAPVLAPPLREVDAFSLAVQTPPPPPKSSARRARAVSNAQDLQSLRPAPPPPVPGTDNCIVSPLHITGKRISQRQQSPNGPREQPAQSVLKNAMALRRMNSEVNYSLSLANLDRESRRYVRLGREASPLLPWINSPDLSEGMDAVFDFDLTTSSCASTGADDVSHGVGISDGIMDDMNLAEIERKLDGALAGFDALPQSDASHDTITSLGVVEKSVRRASVWEDGERYWEYQEKENVAPLKGSSSPTDVLDLTPLKKPAGRQSEEFGWASIQCTPRSLYDSDGFLRT